MGLFGMGKRTAGNAALGRAIGMETESDFLAKVDQLCGKAGAAKGDGRLAVITEVAALRLAIFELAARQSGIADHYAADIASSIAMVYLEKALPELDGDDRLAAAEALRPRQTAYRTAIETSAPANPGTMFQRAATMLAEGIGLPASGHTAFALAESRTLARTAATCAEMMRHLAKASGFV